MLQSQAYQQVHISYELASNRVERFFALLYSPHMQVYPKPRGFKHSSKSNYDSIRPWVYVGQKDSMTAVATVSTLFAVLADPKRKTEYFTPNSFYRNDRRRVDTARWIQAFTLDIDVKGRYAHLAGITPIDVLEMIQTAGLPEPTLIVRTISGGYQPTWILDEPVRATPKTCILYRIIQQYMAQDVEADTQAVGVERIFRTPTEENIVFFNPANTYMFDLFKSWREINHPRGEAQAFWGGKTETNLMDHPAIQKLLDQKAIVGERNNSCFTLALAMKCSNLDENEALTMIQDWFYRAVEKGGKTPLTLRSAQQIVARVYKSKTLHGPKAEVIEKLTGISFSYKAMTYVSRRKERSERKRTHLHEWKQDLLHYLSNIGEISASIRIIAEKLSMPQSTLKRIVNECEAEHLIEVESVRGRNGSTTIRLIKPKPDTNKKTKTEKIIRVDFTSHTKQRLRHKTVSIRANLSISKNSYSHNTEDRVVGGKVSPGSRGSPFT